MAASTRFGQLSRERDTEWARKIVFPRTSNHQRSSRMVYSVAELSLIHKLGKHVTGGEPVIKESLQQEGVSPIRQLSAQPSQSALMVLSSSGGLETFMGAGRTTVGLERSLHSDNRGGFGSGPWPSQAVSSETTSSNPLLKLSALLSSLQEML